ncbi:MAG TPA: M23 family metallopeptidase [Marmoricola sp.]|nr:M23 family metallopeptidase [Marmoricola sp.]HNI69949.1 M23 family metallopeptidase [Marmoricola sp.]
MVGLLAGPSQPPSPGSAPRGVWPLDPRPRVAHGFAPPSVRWGSGHRGVDLSGRAGRPVRSATAGTVIFAGRIAGKPVVVIDIGGGRRTTYEPVTRSVSVGERVRSGQVIGILSLAHGHCLPAACLHWGLIRGSKYLNPLLLIGIRPVRLYPTH